MNIVIPILLVVAGIIALLLLIALFLKKKHYVSREIIINASRQKVFDYIKLLKNQDEFNKNAMAGSDRKREFKGEKNAGVGEKEIKNIIEGERIETEIRFIKPMRVSASIIMETESLPDNQTRVSWSNAGILKYPLNIMIPMMEKHVVKDMDSSLSTLKDILEK